MTMRVYIAGPMTGLPEYNYPAFNQVAAALRAVGYEVMNPAENPVPACGTWQGYMRMALAQLVQCQCVALLPGWTESRGALIERKLAQVLHMDVVMAEDLVRFGKEAQRLDPLPTRRAVAAGALG